MITVALNMVFIVAAFVFGLMCGIVVGCITADGYKSKKTCRECRRRIVEHGFYSDGKQYVAREVGL